MTYLAVPIAACDVGVASAQINAASRGGAEMLELRTDYLNMLNTGVLKAYVGCARSVELPLIVTCRDGDEGGVNDHSLELRSDVLAEAIRCNVDYVDCEFANFCKPDVRKKIEDAFADGSKTRLILSAHNFEGKFDDLGDLYDEIIETFPLAVPKLVYTASHINDCFEAFDLLNNKKQDAIILCMSEHGQVSRLIAKKLGSLVTFASVDEENATASGQVTLEKFKQLYRWDHIDSFTELYGLIGSPVGHSLGPAIFNACFEADETNALYLPLLVAGEKMQFDEFIENIVSRPWLGFHGFSVTLPHKAHALDYAEQKGDFLENLAANIGAVNTLKVGFGSLVSGYNTDYAGAMDALVAAMGIERHGLHKVNVAVIGAGGVSRAVVAGLADVGAAVTIYNRTVAKAAALAEEFKCKYAPLDELNELEADVVINCTSIGMHPNVDATPVPAESINGSMTVFDTVYNPLETLLLKEAAAKGGCTVSGVEMFIRQAMAQHKIFFSEDANEEIMRKTVFDCL